MPLIAAHSHWRDQWLAPATEHVSLIAFLAYTAAAFAPERPHGLIGDGGDARSKEGDDGLGDAQVSEVWREDKAPAQRRSLTATAPLSSNV